MSDCFGDVQDEKVPRCMLGTKEITEKLQKKKKIDQLHINKQTRTMFQEPRSTQRYSKHLVQTTYKNCHFFNALNSLKMHTDIL